MKATLNVPAPVEITVTVEMTKNQAEILRRLCSLDYTIPRKAVEVGTLLPRESVHATFILGELNRVLDSVIHPDDSTAIKNTPEPK